VTWNRICLCIMILFVIQMQANTYIRTICPVLQGYYSWVLQYSVIHCNTNGHVCTGTNPEQQDEYHDIDVCIWTTKSIKILMHARSLFQVTNILPCNWLNTCILHLCICTSVMWLAITILSFDNHLPEDSHCIPKHVGVSYHPCFVNETNFLFDVRWFVPSVQNRGDIFISCCLYCCAFVGINIVY
jgi:hypothetical protein